MTNNTSAAAGVGVEQAGSVFSEAIMLRCPSCKKGMLVNRDPEFDPADAAVSEMICPQCDDGDWHSPTYYRPDGSEMLFGRDYGYPANAPRTRGETA